MNNTFPQAYSIGVTVLLTMYQHLRVAEFCTVELDSAAKLEVSVSRLWLLALSHHFLPTSPLGSVVAVNRELKHATFLSYGRTPEVSISHARTVISPRFSN